MNPLIKHSTITRVDFNSISKEWTDLDNMYDNLFQDFLNNPSIKTKAELLEFQSMQKRLYAIERKLYKISPTDKDAQV